MKPYPVLQALLLLGTTSVYGQINLSAMDSLSADSLQKSEIRYFSPGKGGVNRVWDFSQKLGSKVSSQVLFVKDSTGVISIIEPGRNRYYHSTAADFQPYKYNGKELDKMHGLNTYDYGARQHDPILARWDRIDPLCEKYYNVSPYAYCANSPIILVDPDGKEVRDGLGSYNEENKNLKALVKYLAKHNDSKSIMIVAHGVMRGNEKYASSINIQTYNPKTNEWSDNYISDGKDLSAFLSKNSKVWNNYKAGKIDAEDLHIVFYSCSSSETVKKISSDSEFKDVTFIAPTKDIGVTAKGEVIVSDLKKYSKGNLVIDNSPGKGPGNWNTIRNGKFPAFSQYSRNSNLKPGTAKFIYK